MPRYRSSSQVDARAREELVAVLANELRVPASGGSHQPFIFEQEIPQTDTFHVIVFWDRWREVPPEERSAIIMDAYERTEPSMVPQVTIAMGVTVEEAIRMDLLPFQVQPMTRDSDHADSERLRTLMIEEGAVQTRDGLQLRFPTRRLAEEAMERLLKEAPEGHWTLVETVTSIQD